MAKLVTDATAQRLIHLLNRYEQGGGWGARGGSSRWVMVRCTSATAVGGNSVLNQCYPAIILQPASDYAAPPEEAFGCLLTLLGASGNAQVPVAGTVYAALLTSEVESDQSGSGSSLVNGRPRVFSVPAATLSGTGTDNHIVRWNGTSAIQDSFPQIADSGALSVYSVASPGANDPLVRLHNDSPSGGVQRSYLFLQPYGASSGVYVYSSAAAAGGPPSFTILADNAGHSFQLSMGTSGTGVGVAYYDMSFGTGVTDGATVTTDAFVLRTGALAAASPSVSGSVAAFQYNGGGRFMYVTIPDLNVGTGGQCIFWIDPVKTTSLCAYAITSLGVNYTGYTGTLAPGMSIVGGLVVSAGSGSFVSTSTANTFTIGQTVQAATGTTDVALTLKAGHTTTGGSNILECRDSGGTLILGVGIGSASFTSASNAFAFAGAVSATGTVTGSNLSGTNTGDQTITLTGDVTGSGTGSFAATIGAAKVTLAKIANAGANSVLLGSGAAGSGASYSEITLGSGLSMSGTTLSATGAGGTVTSVSVVTANGVSGTVATATTTPAITLTLGAITPTSVTCSGLGAFTVTDAATNVSGVVGTFAHRSSGTPAAGFGAQFKLQLDSSTNAVSDAGSTVAEWVTPTAGAQRSRVKHSAYDTNSLREYLRGEALSGGVAGVGFLGASAAAQQTGDAGTALVTFGLMSGTPTFAAANLTGTVSNSLAILEDQETSGTQGGSSTASTWSKRTLNTKVSDPNSIVTLANSQITLGAGTYRVRAWAMGRQTNAQQLRFQNVTDATTAITGMVQFNASTDNQSQPCLLAGRFTIAGSKTFELQHNVGSTLATSGFGIAGSFGTEVYVHVEIEKEAT